MFGTKVKVGLKNSVPKEILANIESEEDLEAILENMDSVQFEEPNQNCNDNSDKIEGHGDIEDDVEKRKEKIQSTRDFALCNLKKQAHKMLNVSSSKFPPAKIGDTVRVRIPDVDRARTDGRNILAIVMQTGQDNLYKLGTKHGILNQKYSRNEFTVCKEKFLSVEEVLDVDISLRECARLSSNCGGQGYSRCNCKGGCKSDRCKCRKEKKLCNSKCHHSSSCTNK